jgi:hypothetical protein
MREGSMIVNSSRGGGSKDTWVLAGEPTTAEHAAVTEHRSVPVVPAAPAGGGWSEQQQQQQQAGG